MVSETKIWSVITVVALSTLLGLLSMELGVFSDSDDDNSSVLSGLPSTADNPDPLSTECVDHSGLGHDHSMLAIYINGEQQEIPTNIELTQMSVIKKVAICILFISRWEW